MFNCRRKSGYFKRDGYKVEFIGLFGLPGSATTFNIPVHLGKPDPSREIVGFIASKNGGITPRTISSATILGATVTVQAGGDTIGGTSINAFRVAMPNLHNGGIATITFSGSVADCAFIAIYRVTNRAARNADRFDVSGDSSLGATSLAPAGTTINPNGFLIGLCLNDGPNAYTSTVNAQLMEQFAVGGVQAGAVISPRQGGAAVTPTVTWNWSGSAAGIALTYSFDYQT